MMGEDNQQSNAVSELRYLKTLIDEVDASLRSQREILRRRGMDLPPMVLQGLKGIRSDLDQLENAVLIELTELSQLRSLVDTAAMINSSLDLDEVLTQAMDVVITLTDAERGYIILKDPQTGELDFRITRDMEIGQRRGESGVQISNTIVNEVMQTGNPLLADNAYKDERLQGNLSIANFALRSVLCVPLKYKEGVVGVVYVDNRLRTGVFTEREMKLLEAFANQAAVAIENARLYANIQETLAEITSIKELMSNVFSSIGSGVVTTDPANHVVTFNRAASQILGYPEHEAVTKRVRSLLPIINADIDEYLEKVRERKEGEHLDGQMEHAERGRIALSMKLSPLEDGGQQMQGVAMVIDDVTEQLEREEKLNILKRYLPKELVERAPELAKLGLGGERREVTCVFADVLPIATFRNLPPHQLMEILNRHLAVATECIHGAGGIIDKYMGNEIMGLFNSQLNPVEDHALKSVVAALDMRDAFGQLYAQLGVDPSRLYYRIGMNTGVALLGNVGSLDRRDFSAIGDTINLSHRLLENATADQILISDDTRAHMEPNGGKSLPVRCEARGEIQVKGRAKAVNIYEVFRA